eukprot:CAMPEP_0194337616 /NCGR_PEP_ID=MMETSP0171-20130528/76901_1 /TAXON_ID=218684 /ORGANISM="Corethron pennatum, Strain L29A3" /LENGTH=68 /DNA_ID=CAMNT_0039101463 /DNA_START=401 /DNA_END=607 /DNA_ORIENTATION=+
MIPRKLRRGRDAIRATQKHIAAIKRRALHLAKQLAAAREGMHTLVEECGAMCKDLLCLCHGRAFVVVA